MMNRMCTDRLRSLTLALLLAAPSALHAAALATVAVETLATTARHTADGVIEAVRDSTVAAQVAGRITELRITEGSRVKAGEVLLTIDARAAADQLAARRALLAEAEAEYRRRQDLFAKKMISRSEMDRAEAAFRSARAQAGAATTEADFFTVRAPYDAVIADVPVELGDMAQPGRVLLRLYDPAALRISVHVPEGVAARLDATRPATIALPAGATPASVDANFTVLPTADPATHTQEVRADLPAVGGIAPGQFTRAQLPLAGDAAGMLTVPLAAIVRRSEFSGVYVVSGDGRAQLRQVRLGRVQGTRVEVLAGVLAGEQVALDPLAAARRGSARHE